MKILSLDLSPTVGFAHDRTSGDDGVPITGTWELPPLDAAGVGRAEAWLFAQIEDVIRFMGIECLVFEAPLPIPAHVGRAKKDPELAAALIGLAHVADCCGEYLKLRGIAPTLEIFTCNVQTVRRHFVGNGRPANPKGAVKMRCRQLGWNVVDDNAADAAAQWCYAKSIRCPKWAPKGTPLFANGRALAC